MSWKVVARKDFQDAIRSWWLWGLSILFVMLFTLPALLRFYVGWGEDPMVADGTVAIYIFIMKEPLSLLVPVIAIVVSYSSITKEHTSGTMKLLLSLPHARWEVVLGKVVGRSAVMVAPILLGFLISFLVILPAASSFALQSYLTFTLLTAMLGVVFVAISVSISAVATSDRRAMVGVVGVYLFAVFFWNQFADAIADGAHEYAGVDTGTRYLIELFVKVLNPVEAYKTLVDAIVMGTVEARQQAFGFFIFPDPEAIEALGETVPGYVADPAIVGYMLVWLALSVAFGIAVFRDRDL